MTQENFTIMLNLIWQVGIPVAFSLIAIHQKKKTVAQAINDMVPILWNVTQQDLRKGQGRLPGDEKPLDHALKLLETSSPVKIPKSQLPLVAAKLRAFHEQMGAPTAYRAASVGKLMKSELVGGTSVKVD